MAGLHSRICAASLALALSIPAFSSEPARAVTATAEVRYRLIELPSVQTDGQEAFLFPEGLNNRGEVLATDQGFPARYFIYQKGKIVTELKSPDPAYPYLYAAGINNRSQIVGWLTTSYDFFGASRAYVWKRGQFTVLGPLPSSGGNTQAFGISDFGEVAGYSLNSDMEIFPTAFRWYAGQFTEWPFAAPDLAIAVDVNNNRDVIGTAWYAPNTGGSYPIGGYVWGKRGSLRFLDPPPGARGVRPVDINNRGQITGTTGFPSGRTHAFLWEDGAVQDLGTLPGGTFVETWAINESGAVVGQGNHAGSGLAAWVWRDGQMRNLNDLIAADDPLKSRVHLVTARAINDAGWIAGGGVDPADLPFGEWRGYLLIPTN
jgi:probable HAF family extracellular repeat protein